MILKGVGVVVIVLAMLFCIVMSLACAWAYNAWHCTEANLVGWAFAFAALGIALLLRNYLQCGSKI